MLLQTQSDFGMVRPADASFVESPGCRTNSPIRNSLAVWLRISRVSGWPVQLEELGWVGILSVHADSAYQLPQIVAKRDY